MHRLSCPETPGMREDDERRPPVCSRGTAQSRLHSGCPSRCLADTGVMLEIASGTGEHIVHFARNLPGLVFQPSDPEPDASLSIAAWVKATGVTNVRAPIALEASHSVWPIASAEGIVCINMTHTSPWKATLGLLKAAAAILRPRRRSISMGPINGTGSQRPEQPSVRPKPSLSQSELGLRDLEAVAATARSLDSPVQLSPKCPRTI